MRIAFVLTCLEIFQLLKVNCKRNIELFVRESFKYHLFRFSKMGIVYLWHLHEMCVSMVLSLMYVVLKKEGIVFKVKQFQSMKNKWSQEWAHWLPTTVLQLFCGSGELSCDYTFIHLCAFWGGYTF